MSAEAPSIELAELVDLDAYPLDRPDSDEYRRAVDEARAGLRSVGCAVVRDLVRPDAVRRLNDEIVERKHTTHYSTQVINPYFHMSPNPDYPDHHAVNTFLERSSGFIPGDRMADVRLYAPYPVFHVTGKGGYYFATVMGGPRPPPRRIAALPGQGQS